MQPTPLIPNKDGEDLDMKALMVGRLLQLARTAGENGFGEFSNELFYIAMRWSQRPNWRPKPQTDLKLTKAHMRTLLQ